MVCMICQGIVQEPQKWSNWDHWVCSKCISDCCVKNSLEAKCKFCNNFSFMPLVDDNMLEMLQKLRFKWFLCKGINCNSAGDSEYIPYEKVRVHDSEWKFKMKQNINKHAENYIPKAQKDIETKKRFNTKQNINVMLQERLKGKTDVAQRVRDLTGRAKRQMLPQNNSDSETEESKTASKSAPKKQIKQPAKPKSFSETLKWFMWNEDIHVSTSRYKEVMRLSGKEVTPAKNFKMRNEIVRFHVIQDCSQRYVTCHFCKTVVARKNFQNHIKTNCGEEIVKCGNCQSDFKKDSELFKTHSWDDKVKEKKYKELLQQNFLIQDQVDNVNKQIDITSESTERTSHEILKIRAMIQKINEYMVQNRKTLTDDEGEDTIDTSASPVKSKKLLYEEGFAYRKENSSKIILHAVCNKGTDQFLTGDQNGIVKLWSLDSKSSIATIDILRMMFTLYPLSSIYKSEKGQAKAQAVDNTVTYKLLAMTQWNSSNLCFAVGIYTPHEEVSTLSKTAFLWIQPDLKEDGKSLKIESLPQFGDMREFMENENKINRMFWVSDAIHSGRITKIIDLKTMRDDYLLSVDDQKTMIVWKLEDGKCNHIETFSKGFGSIEDVIEFRRQTSEFYGCIALAFDDKRIAVLQLKFRPSKKDPDKIKVQPEFKSCINLVNVPKYMWEVGGNQLVIASVEYLYYYNQKTSKWLQPTSPSVYQFQSICAASDSNSNQLVTIEGAKILKLWDQERSYDKQVHTKAADKILWLEKIPGRRAIILCGNGGVMRFLVAYKDNSY